VTQLVATYRLQLTGAFGFRDAANIVPYLRDLGISHIYASPILTARAGSTHGYDVVDPTRLNPELGGDAGFAQLITALRAAGMGLIADFVPNHMGVHHADNPWWLDVLAWGRASPHARAFDIDWAAQRGRVLLPILGRPYGEALDGGEIVLRYEPGAGFSAWYFEHRLPIAPGRYGAILRAIVRRAGADTSPAGRAILALARERCPYGHPTRAEAPAVTSDLAAIPGSAEVIAAGLSHYNDAAKGPRALHGLLERQHWRLAHWRLASREINYRRFFDISTLAGLRVEDQRVFDEVHARIAPLIADGSLDGLRLDHIDGLADPMSYCARLHAMAAKLRPDRECHIFVEKILGEGERLPAFEGVDGTTGYEWLNVISGVLVDRDGLRTLDRVWRLASGDARPFADILAGAKREVLDKLLTREFAVLCASLSHIAAGHYPTRDIAADRLQAALERFIVNLPVYRTYVTPAAASDEDRMVIDRAIGAARAAPGADGPALDVLRDALTRDLVAPGRVGYSRRRVADFARRTQQLTGPVMAKSLEDTAGYRFHRLLAFNEVGGEPDSSGLSPEEFHQRMWERAAGDHGLTATATHDTKRGEDARARLLALSELDDEWAAAVAQWQADNARFVRRIGARRSPSGAHEYMIYQALLGAWPVDGDIGSPRERFQAYARKAAREGKQETSWLDPDEDYENGLTGFIGDILDDTTFRHGFDALARRIALLGALNSLSQVALKVSMPGIPDFYQGCEFWDLSLVDPDNRRAVDFAARRSALSTPVGDLRALADTWRDGRIKLAVTRQLLAWRRARADVFAHGDVRPLTVEGPHRDRVIAFARVLGDEAAILVAGRCFAALTDGGRRWPRAESWDGQVLLDDLKLVDGTERKLSLSRLFDAGPVAMLGAVRTSALSTASAD
jgi:(1->4)-alpha-D-glucan 1-alpha-D-glucosylmutase